MCAIYIVLIMPLLLPAHTFNGGSDCDAVMSIPSLLNALSNLTESESLGKHMAHNPEPLTPKTLSIKTELETYEHKDHEAEHGFAVSDCRLQQRDEGKLLV